MVGIYICFPHGIRSLLHLTTFYYRRPTGIPAKDLLAYDMPVLQAHKEALQNYAKELQASNEEEKKKIQTTVEQIEETEKLIESLLAKNEQTIGVLSSIPSL